VDAGLESTTARSRAIQSMMSERSQPIRRPWKRLLLGKRLRITKAGSIHFDLRVNRATSWALSRS
jgi:hypothetical protein